MTGTTEPTTNVLPGLRTKGPVAARGTSPLAMAWRRLRRDRIATISLIYIGFVFLVGILAPILPVASFSDQNLNIARQPPTLEHPLGTDDFGRDMLSRLVWGAQTALLVATIPVGISMSLGVIVGTLAGYAGGWIDTLLMRFTEFLLAFPGMLLMIFLAATLKPQIVALVREVGPYIGQAGLWRTGIIDYLAILIILATVGWPGLARLVRGQVLSLKQRDYVEAARAIGAPTRRILFRHLVPNLGGLLIVIASMTMASAIAGESLLSFLGIGIVPPYPSWGSMIAATYSYLRTPFWYLLVAPIVMVATMLFAFTYLGDGLSDAVNPQTR